MMHYRTAKSVPAIPPKADKPFTPPPPGFLEADAKRCNARLRSKEFSPPEEKVEPRASTRSQLDLLAKEAAVLAVLETKMRGGDIYAVTNMLRNTVRRALERLEAKGLVKSDKGNGRNTTWERI